MPPIFGRTKSNGTIGCSALPWPGWHVRMAAGATGCLLFIDDDDEDADKSRKMNSEVVGAMIFAHTQPNASELSKRHFILQML